MKEYLGKSQEYPINATSDGQLTFVSGRNNVEQSIAEILGTRKGERFFRREWGSNLNLLVFEPNDETLEALLDYHIKEALGEFETRIRVVRTNIQNMTIEKAEIEIVYEELQSKEINSFIYPFYRQIEQ